jgi:hypothetical protein
MPWLTSPRVKQVADNLACTLLSLRLLFVTDARE